MVLGAFEKYVFGPRREERRLRLEAERRLEEFQTAWETWYERKLDAEAQGKPFDEKPPSRKA